MELKSAWLPPLVLLLLALAFFFSWLTMARLAYQHALTFSKRNDWRAARTALIQAAAEYGIFKNGKMTAAPWYVPSADARRLDIAVGENYLAEAWAASETNELVAALKNAEASFRAALRRQALDATAQTGLTRAVDALHRGFAWFAPGQNNPYQAQPEFEKLLRLYPNSIEAHLLFIRYLNSAGQDDGRRLAELTSHLAAIYPPSADALKRELSARRDWRDRLAPALATGLRAAIAENNQAATAYRSLSQLAEGRDDMTAAVDNLLRALALDLADSGGKPALARDYTRLADLYLRQNDAATDHEAERAAMKALRLSVNRDQTLRQLWRTYKENQRFQEFLNLLARTEEAIRLPDSRRILQAACLSELGNTAAAQANLGLVKERDYQAEALRSLAELARREKNWDAMELTAQRTTVIEPKNSGNFYLFAQALRAQKKYHQAVVAMDEAIATATKEDPSLYNFRAWNRWDDNRLEEARADWLKAIELLPGNAYFYRSLAMTYEKEGARLQAVAAMKKAVALAPGNVDFVKKLQELQK